MAVVVVRVVSAGPAELVSECLVHLLQNGQHSVNNHVEEHLVDIRLRGANEN